jgi:hypothetical protein
MLAAEKPVYCSLARARKYATTRISFYFNNPKACKEVLDLIGDHVYQPLSRIENQCNAHFSSTRLVGIDASYALLHVLSVEFLR